MADKSTAPSKDLVERAIAHVKTGKGLENQIVKVVGLDMPRGGEADERVTQVKHIVELLQKYHAAGDSERPLSIVVFGPPGSGKSTFVNSITYAVPGCKLVTTVEPAGRIWTGR